MFEDLRAPTQAAPPTEPHRALYLRWRPQRFEDVVGQEHVTRTLRNAVKLGRPAHAYLFTGPRGTGKTTVARILYRAVNCEYAEDGDPDNTCPLCRAALDGRALDLVEIDAASNRGIDDIRDLRDKVAFRPGEGRYRVYIIDEAHELTPAAWEAFLKTLEEPPPHALFVLATTEAHKVPATIVSRCQRFDFRRIPYEATKEQLARVAAAEGLEVEPAVFERLALVARGGLRDALSLLDQLSAFAVGEITMDVARAALSLPSIEAVRGAIDGMTRRDPGSVMAIISDAAEGGADLRLFVDELIVHLRALMLLSTGADARLSNELPADEVAWLRERAPAWSVGALMQLVQTLSDALARTRDAAQFQVQTEVALLTACDVDSPTRPASRLVPPGEGSDLSTVAPTGEGSGISPRQARPTAGAARPASTVDTPDGEGQTVSTVAPKAEGPHLSSVAPKGEGSDISPRQATPTAGAAGLESAVDTPGGEDQSVSAVAQKGGDSNLPTVGPMLEDGDLSPGEGPATAEEDSAPGEKHSPLSLRQGEGGQGGVGRSLAERWPDVIEHIQRRNPLLASIVRSALPLGFEDQVLTVAFTTDHNRKSAERSKNREVIEAACERVYGAAYRLRAIYAEDRGSLLDDPVINFAQRTFGGEPKRISTE